MEKGQTTYKEGENIIEKIDSDGDGKIDKEVLEKLAKEHWKTIEDIINIILPALNKKKEELSNFQNDSRGKELMEKINEYIKQIEQLKTDNKWSIDQWVPSAWWKKEKGGKENKTYDEVAEMLEDENIWNSCIVEFFKNWKILTAEEYNSDTSRPWAPRIWEVDIVLTYKYLNNIFEKNINTIKKYYQNKLNDKTLTKFRRDEEQLRSSFWDIKEETDEPDRPYVWCYVNEVLRVTRSYVKIKDSPSKEWWYWWESKNNAQLKISDFKSVPADWKSTIKYEKWEAYYVKLQGKKLKSSPIVIADNEEEAINKAKSFAKTRESGFDKGLRVIATISGAAIAFKTWYFALKSILPSDKSWDWDDNWWQWDP